MKKFLIIFAVVFYTATVFAQDESGKCSFSVELDPAPFVLGGYSFSVKYFPEDLSATAFMFSIYASDFPDAMMSSVNKERGWKNLQLKTSYAFFAEYFFSRNRIGFYFGPSVFYYNKSVESGLSGESVTFSTLYPNVRAGYVWYPVEDIDLYINPWLNIGSEINLDKKNELKGITFKPATVYYIAALHIGYNLNW